ncbi:UNVERIFIED_CONTAM: transposase InsO family protein [Brevibacillus sp. OAP136]
MKQDRQIARGRDAFSRGVVQRRFLILDKTHYLNRRGDADSVRSTLFILRKLARNRTITRSNQPFETDIKYGYIAGEERFFFIQSCIDVYDRSIIAFHIGLSCEAKDVVRTLQRALFKRQLFDATEKPVIRSDNGPQFVSHAFQQACEDFGIEHERIPPKTPNMHAHIESFHRLLQDPYEFQTYGEAYEVVTDYIRYYNERRIHSSIRDLAHTSFTKKNKNQLIPITTVRV